MKPFIGFTTNRAKAVRVPEGFFEEVLPQITSMLEMKMLLYLFWRLARSGSNGEAPRMVSLEELEQDDRLRSALAHSKGPRPYDEALQEGLELCVARGTVLQLWVREEANSGQWAAAEGRSGSEQYASSLWYVLNTKESRAWVEALGRGEIDVLETPLGQMYQQVSSVGSQVSGTPSSSDPRPPTPDPRHRIRVIAERPSIYTLYEQNIGLLTPILAEQLQDAEGRYPVEWIEDAFSEAVLNNKRNWRYIERILERWAAEGKDSGKDREAAKRGFDLDKYTRGKYAFLFRPDK